MLSAVERYVIARESNIVRVDFNHEPDPPAPCFPGAGGRRLDDSARESADTRDRGPLCSIIVGGSKKFG